MLLQTFRIVLHYNDTSFDKYCTPLDLKASYCKQKGFKLTAYKAASYLQHVVYAHFHPSKNITFVKI